MILIFELLRKQRCDCAPFPQSTYTTSDCSWIESRNGNWTVFVCNKSW